MGLCFVLKSGRQSRASRPNQGEPGDDQCDKGDGDDPQQHCVIALGRVFQTQITRDRNQNRDDSGEQTHQDHLTESGAFQAEHLPDA